MHYFLHKAKIFTVINPDLFIKSHYKFCTDCALRFHEIFSNSSLFFLSRLTSAHCDSDAEYYFRFVSHYNLTNFPPFQRFRRGSLPVGNGNCSDHVVVGSPNICALFAIPNYFDYPNWKSIYALPTTFSGSSAQMYLSFSTVSYINYY